MTEALWQCKVKLYVVCIVHTTFFHKLNMSKQLNKSEVTGPNHAMIEHHNDTALQLCNK
jgi:hypothetical protein